MERVVSRIGQNRPSGARCLVKHVTWSVSKLSSLFPESFWRDTGFAPFRAHLQPVSKENQLPNPIWKLGPGTVRSAPEMRIVNQIFIPLFTVWPWSCSVFCWMYWLAAEIRTVMQKSVGMGTWILHSHQFRHIKKLQEAVESTVWLHAFAERFLDSIWN